MISDQASREYLAALSRLNRAQDRCEALRVPHTEPAGVPRQRTSGDQEQLVAAAELAAAWSAYESALDRRFAH